MKMVTWAQWYLETLFYEMRNVSWHVLICYTHPGHQEQPASRTHLAPTLTTTSSGHSSCRITLKPHFIPSGTDTAVSFNCATDGHEASLLKDWNWYDRAWNYLKSMPNLLWNLIALFCAQERIKRAGLLRVVIPGRVRVPIRLPPRVRCLRCRLQLDGKDKVSEALGEVVLQLPPGWWAQAGGSAWRSLLPVISTLQWQGSYYWWAPSRWKEFSTCKHGVVGWHTVLLYVGQMRDELNKLIFEYSRHFS